MRPSPKLKTLPMKIKSQNQISLICATLRRRGLSIVFTNGCFDILHVGHVKYLNQAKSLGDILVIGLNDDASVRKLKGAGRPVNKGSDRAEILSALVAVDYVVLFKEDAPEKLIHKVKPHYLVK